jgi:hypothetical protein
MALMDDQTLSLWIATPPTGSSASFRTRHAITSRIQGGSGTAV